jgi:hypothetical protein
LLLKWSGTILLWLTGPILVLVGYTSLDEVALPAAMRLIGRVDVAPTCVV